MASLWPGDLVCILAETQSWGIWQDCPILESLFPPFGSSTQSGCVIAALEP